MKFVENIHYDKIGLTHYRVIKTFKTETGIIPPDGKPIKTKFAYLSSKGILSIYRGFCWDGATGALDTDDFMRGSCIHDWFCNAVNNGDLPIEYRKKGDDLIEKIILEDGMNKFRADYVHKAVSIWGKIKHNLDIEYEYPNSKR